MKKILIAAAVAAFATGAANAAESGFIMTTFKGGDKNVLAIELDNSGSLAAFDLAINMPGLKKSQLDLSKCASGVAMGACNFKDGVLYISAASVEPFKSGTIGHVTINGNMNSAKLISDKSNFYSDQSQKVNAEVLADNQPIAAWSGRVHQK